ncbi:PPE family protein [Mycobacterium sp. 94-17]|uniref:PPE family protein n=1 Tax=Mycobacterium sp. 94-17 TaxID=2986147 RepID=UPI002D1E84CB|nr:PPE family protein [Mycobacterium sp. 94-17]MEB4210084.1 PPE family protein [Mycobacterium sp. 94-17]
MDYGAFPPEFNSARMYAGPGPESMLAAAAAWNGLAAELRSVASTYGSVISGLIDGAWLGPSSTAMATAAMPYVAWLTTAATEAETTATQAQAAVGAYQTAFAMTVPPPLIAENRAELSMLVASNVLGQNTPAIAANQAQYGEMWAQDAAAMYGYAANSGTITAAMTPFAPPPETTNAAGMAAQGVQDAATSASGGTQSALSKVMSAVPSTLNGLGSAGSSTSSASGLLSGLLDGSASGASTTSSFLGSTTTGDFMSSVLQQYAVMPAWAAMFIGQTALTPLMTAYAPALTPPVAAADAAVADGAAAAEGAADSALGAGGAGVADLGAVAGVGEAASVGALAVPPAWGWAAAGLPATMAGVPLTLPGIDIGAAGGLPMAAGLPMMMGGLPGVAAAGAAGAAAGAAGAKYLPRLRVLARSPAAGYSAASASPPGPKYPVPAAFPTNGHAPPGYQPAIVYLPSNGHQPAHAEN